MAAPSFDIQIVAGPDKPDSRDDEDYWKRDREGEREAGIPQGIETYRLHWRQVLAQCGFDRALAPIPFPLRRRYHLQQAQDGTIHVTRVR